MEGAVSWNPAGKNQELRASVMSHSTPVSCLTPHKGKPASHCVEFRPQEGFSGHVAELFPGPWPAFPAPPTSLHASRLSLFILQSLPANKPCSHWFYRQTLFPSVLQILHFLQIKGLWQPCGKQVYQLHFLQ